MDLTRMRDLIDRLIEAKFMENTYFDTDPVRPHARAPASPQQLAVLDDFLRRKNLSMPSDYRLFLSVCNGIEMLLGPSMSLWSLEEVAQDDHGIFEEMVELCPGCDQFVIGGGNTPDILSFDITTSQVEHDYEVIWITGDASLWRLKNFEDFLVSYLAILERSVLAQQKDRENLAP